MEKRMPFRASLVAAALASAAGLAVAAEGYVTDSRGTPVIDRTGDCVQSIGATPGANCYPGVNEVQATTTPRAMPSAEPGTVAPGAEYRPAPSAVQTARIGEIAHPTEHGFVTDSRGNVVRDNTGDCVESGIGGGAAVGIPACGGVIAEVPVVPMPAQAEPPPMTAEPREIPLRRITLDTDTTFNFDSAELTDQGKEQLDDIIEAGASEDIERMRIHVIGYADRIGPTDYNLDLSQRRAEAAREYLISEGLPADIITAEGRGETNPVVQCEGMSGVSLVECLRPNRRSEVEFAALERAPDAVQEEPAPSAPPSEPWAPGTDTGTPR